MTTSKPFDLDQAVRCLEERTALRPAIALILGSGMGDFEENVQIAARIPFADIQGMPTATVEGHSGAFVFGYYKGKTPVVLLNGRLHYYEGYSQREITYPILLLHRLGVRELIITNAAGGINTSFSPGTLMLIADHINYSGSNPLIGRNDDALGPRFPDMSDVYNAALRERVMSAAAQQGLELRQGVYAMYSGPSYETPAEIRFLRVIGADAVGMSTVPESIVASYCGMRVLGVSCITNMAAGVLPRKLAHAEVLESAKHASERIALLLELILDILRDDAAFA